MRFLCSGRGVPAMMVEEVSPATSQLLVFCIEFKNFARLPVILSLGLSSLLLLQV